MPKKTRVRRFYSIADELVSKSREAALAAVQIFNSPTITFKSEIFICLMNIAWTYLLHAHYRKIEVEYRYYQTTAGGRRRFDKTKGGAHKHWELERCLNEKQSPVDRDTVNNLRFLIGIRHEIEHQMTTRIDSSLSAKFQACCLNYNHYAKKLFGDEHGIEKHLAFSLQFSSISHDQVESLPSAQTMPSHIKSYVDDFEQKLSDAEYNSPLFAYRVLFVAKTANHKGQADEVIEFVKGNTELATDVNTKYALVKETERPKHLPAGIVKTMQKEGYKKFTVHWHTQLWQAQDAKKDGKGYGVQIGNQWYWYDRWVDLVRAHCKENAAKYGKT